MTKNINIGEPPKEIAPTTKKPLVILINEFGAGKSLTSERLLQQDCIGGALGIDFTRKRLRRAEIKNILADSKK